MKVQHLAADDDAVSPVIGVILMVAITVILAAVIGTFVLGIGQGQQTTPQASVDFDYDGGANTVTVTHTGGDSFTTENSGALTVTANSTDYDWLAGAGPISAGSSVAVGSGGSQITGWTPGSGDTVRLVWEAPGGDKTGTVASFEVP